MFAGIPHPLWQSTNSLGDVKALHDLAPTRSLCLLSHYSMGSILFLSCFSRKHSPLLFSALSVKDVSFMHSWAKRLQGLCSQSWDPGPILISCETLDRPLKLSEAQFPYLKKWNVFFFYWCLFIWLWQEANDVTYVQGLVQSLTELINVSSLPSLPCWNSWT